MIGTGGIRCRGAGRGIEADFGPEHADTFRRDLRADYVLANPPFNDSDWFRTALREAQNPKQGRLTCRVWENKDDDPRHAAAEAAVGHCGSATL